MKRIRLILVTFLILAISFTTYMHLKKQPVENIPKKATLVYENSKAKEVLSLYDKFKIQTT